MKNRIVRSICDSLLFKIAGVILLCAAGAGILFSGFAAIEMKESNIDSTPSDCPISFGQFSFENWTAI